MFSHTCSLLLFTLCLYHNHKIFIPSWLTHFLTLARKYKIKICVMLRAWLKWIAHYNVVKATKLQSISGFDSFDTSVKYVDCGWICGWKKAPGHYSSDRLIDQIFHKTRCEQLDLQRCLYVIIITFLCQSKRIVNKIRLNILRVILRENARAWTFKAWSIGKLAPALFLHALNFDNRYFFCTEMTSTHMFHICTKAILPSSP